MFIMLVGMRDLSEEQGLVWMAGCGACGVYVEDLAKRTSNPPSYEETYC
jgi:hypothetical protein